MEAKMAADTKAQAENAIKAAVVKAKDRNAIPPLLREWGVDEALWSQVQDKTRLRKLAKDGDELNGRKRVASLRVKLGLE
jgi:hypothetical protein